MVEQSDKNSTENKIEHVTSKQTIEGEQKPASNALKLRVYPSLAQTTTSEPRAYHLKSSPA